MSTHFHLPVQSEPAPAWLCPAQGPRLSPGSDLQPCSVGSACQCGVLSRKLFAPDVINVFCGPYWPGSSREQVCVVCVLRETQGTGAALAQRLLSAGRPLSSLGEASLCSTQAFSGSEETHYSMVGHLLCSESSDLSVSLI